MNRPVFQFVFSRDLRTVKITGGRLVGEVSCNWCFMQWHAVKVSQTDLVGVYLGQIFPKTFVVIKKVSDRVCFFNKARVLTMPNSDDKFGSEEIDPLLKLMEANRNVFGYCRRIFGRDDKICVQ